MPLPAPRFTPLSSAVVMLLAGAAGAHAQEAAIPGPERLTLDQEGELAFGIYYGEAQQLSATAGITVPGVFGTDEHLDLALSSGRYFSSLAGTLTDPDFFEGPYTRELSLGIKTVKPHKGQVGDYAFSQAEMAISFGRRLSSTLAYSFGAGVSAYSFDDLTIVPNYVSEYIAETDEHFQDYFTYVNVAWDHIQSNGWMQAGTSASAYVQMGVIDAETYGLLSLNANSYRPISDRLELRAHGRIQIGDSFGDGPFPIFHTFTGGGPGSVRGYSENTLGPTSAVPGTSKPTYPGGKVALSGGLEIKTPLGPRDQLFGIAYLDIGNVYASAQDLDSHNLRSAIGLGLRWETQAGPLSIFLSEPINHKTNDKITQLQIMLGVQF